MCGLGSWLGAFWVVLLLPTLCIYHLYSVASLAAPTDIVLSICFPVFAVSILCFGSTESIGFSDSEGCELHLPSCRGGARGEDKLSRWGSRGCRESREGWERGERAVVVVVGGGGGRSAESGRGNGGRCWEAGRGG